MIVRGKINKSGSISIQVISKIFVELKEQIFI
jgi:hypothetical protein